MSVDTAQHWSEVWRSAQDDQLSWYQAHPTRSLALITEYASDHDAAVIDVGGGASRLVDDLLDAGYRDLTVLDIAAEALERARQRLGARSTDVSFIHADVADARLPRRYRVWHDRAVFHFLVGPTDQQAYVAQLRRAVEPDGLVVIATFSPDGPERCSGLPVRRYGAPELALALGPSFEPVTFATETHTTPAGVDQEFLYGAFRRAGGGDEQP